MNEHDDLDDGDISYQEDKIHKEEIKIADILLHGTPAAKQEIIVKLIYIGNTQALNSVLYAMNDIEYRRVMPTA